LRTTCTAILIFKRFGSARTTVHKQATSLVSPSEKTRKTKLFNGLPELYENWGRLSKTGAHSTPQAILSRFKITETGKDIHYQMNYTGVEIVNGTFRSMYPEVNGWIRSRLCLHVESRPKSRSHLAQLQHLLSPNVRYGPFSDGLLPSSRSAIPIIVRPKLELLITHRDKGSLPGYADCLVDCHTC
jgi:hypothetical protein